LEIPIFEGGDVFPEKYDIELKDVCKVPRVC